VPFRKRARRWIAPVIVALTLAGSAAPMLADEYDAQRAGHPARIVAYVAHPVGVILDLLIFRPAHWLGSFEPVAKLFGHEPYSR
jgi:hypothetical protein